MDNKLYQMLLEYIKVIQQQIENNRVMIDGVSEQIERSKKIQSETTDLEALTKLAEENLQAIKKINTHINKQEELIMKFRRISEVYANDIEIQDIAILEELLTHYEKAENYEHCAVLRDKISIHKQYTDKLRDISKKELPGHQ